ncbi:class I SAM-dependent methyltransferase [Knoellia koreensis]|uniref:Class I SAM-dependent methyltransferase n=1 Tax=Knoellia koreensis TaxID=2730921 RepID=A0A849H925_9MICO|nr:class I SAM-dependent methyltransferase [Knoellia sp. DB2414S]NNM44435.1 class I SAM-dependent methyltransferase [Knoellia sp. DB2414S]
MHFEQMAADYSTARPRYPVGLLDLLHAEGIVGQGKHLLEVGAGSGLATRDLLRFGSTVVAVEPGAELATGLSRLAPEVEVMITRLEDADLPDHSFDSVVAATSMHWVDLPVALPKLHTALRPGGWLAVWRHCFGDDAVTTPFRHRVEEIVTARAQPPGSPAPRRDDRPTMDELSAGGWFEPVRTESWRWSIDLTAQQARALFRTFSDWSNREVEAVGRAVADEGGTVTEHYRTVLHLLRGSTAVPQI